MDNNVANYKIVQYYYNIAKTQISSPIFLQNILFRKRQEASERCPPSRRYGEGRVPVHPEPGEGPELPESREQGDTSIYSLIMLDNFLNSFDITGNG